MAVTWEPWAYHIRVFLICHSQTSMGNKPSATTILTCHLLEFQTCYIVVFLICHDLVMFDDVFAPEGHQAVSNHADLPFFTLVPNVLHWSISDMPWPACVIMMATDGLVPNKHQTISNHHDVLVMTLMSYHWWRWCPWPKLTANRAVQGNVNILWKILENHINHASPQNALHLTYNPL